MKKTLLLFDVDGTIASSGKLMDSSIQSFLLHLPADIFDIGVVGGGTFEKITAQLQHFKPRYLFTECGSVCHFHMDGEYILQYKNKLIEHDIYEYIPLFIRAGLTFLTREIPYVSGHFVDIRNGLLYISLIGLQGTDEDRRLFIAHDEKFHCRKRLCQQFEEMKQKYELEGKLEITIGGQTGVAIYPTEWNKKQILEKIMVDEYQSIFFFGDRYEPNGNDYALMHTPGVTGVPVNNVQETFQYLKQIVMNEESYRKSDEHHYSSVETTEHDHQSHCNGTEC